MSCATGPAASMPAPAVARRRRRGAQRSHATRRRLLWLAFALAAAYPLFVLSYVYWHTLSSGLPGRRHGPQDAYRHTLASAVVAYTVSPRAVQWVTTVMESDDDAPSRMDRHNNAIGAAIGVRAESFAQIRPFVMARVAEGRVDAADARQVTWLPRSRWSELPF